MILCYNIHIIYYSKIKIRLLMKNIYKVLMVCAVGLVLGGCPKNDYSVQEEVYEDVNLKKKVITKPIPGEEFLYDKKHPNFPFEALNKHNIRPLKLIVVIDYDKKHKKYYVAMSDSITNIKYVFKKNKKAKPTLVIKGKKSILKLLKFNIDFGDISVDSYYFSTSDQYMKTYKKMKRKRIEYQKSHPYYTSKSSYFHTGLSNLRISDADECLMFIHYNLAYQYGNIGRVPIFILIPYDIKEKIDFYEIQSHCKIGNPRHYLTNFFNLDDKDTIKYLLAETPPSLTDNSNNNKPYKVPTTEDKVRGLKYKVESLEDEIKRLKWEMKHKQH